MILLCIEIGIVYKIGFCKPTTIESTISNACDAVGDSDRGKGGAIPKSLIPYICYAIRDRDIG